LREICATHHHSIFVAYVARAIEGTAVVTGNDSSENVQVLLIFPTLLVEVPLAVAAEFGCATALSRQPASEAPAFVRDRDRCGTRDVA